MKLVQFRKRFFYTYTKCTKQAFLTLFLHLRVFFSPNVPSKRFSFVCKPRRISPEQHRKDRETVSPLRSARTDTHHHERKFFSVRSTSNRHVRNRFLLGDALLSIFADFLRHSPSFPQKRAHRTRNPSYYSPPNERRSPYFSPRGSFSIHHKRHTATRKRFSTFFNTTFLQKIFLS